MISSPALYHCATLILVFTTDIFRYSYSAAERLVVVLFWLNLWEFLFTTPGIELDTSGSLALHSFTVPQCYLVFTSDNFRYLTLMKRDWRLYLSDWNCGSCFYPTGNWTEDLWISSLALYYCGMGTSGFHLWKFQVFILWCREIGGGIVLIGPVRVSFCPTGNWTKDFWSSSYVLYCCAMVTSGFHLG